MTPDTSIRIRLTPRGGRDAVVGWEGDVLRVRVAAPPVEGRANEALLNLLARHLGVPRRDITLTHGATSRHKMVAVARLDAATVRARLAAAPPPTPPGSAAPPQSH